MTGYVYSLSNRITGQTFYIGSTFDPKTRLICHLSNARKGESGMYKYLLANGIEFDLDIIDEVHTRKDYELMECEIFWIEQFRQWGFPLLNKLFYKSRNKKSSYRREPEPVATRQIKDLPFSVRLPDYILAALKDECEKSDRSLNWVICNILRQHPIVKDYFSKEKIIMDNLTT